MTDTTHRHGFSRLPYAAKGLDVPNDLIEVARFQSAADAALARNTLESADIAARLDGEAMAGWFWHFGSSIGGVRVLVSDEDAERASAVLSADVAIDDEVAIDFGDESPDDTAEDSETPPELTRAFRASILGMFLLPPLLNLYSTYLIIRHRLLRPPLHWKLVTALLANSGVFLFIATIAGLIMAPQDPPATIYSPDGTPVEVFHKEESVPIPIVP